MVTCYAGEVGWRGRSMRGAEATDAYAAPYWVPLAAKMTALSGVVAVVLVACALFTIGYPLVDGYTNIEPLLYATALGLQLVSFVLMAALAVFFQVATGTMIVASALLIASLVLRVCGG